MKNPEFTPTIMKTEDYGIFKTLEGNRDVINLRKARIRKSIERVWYIPVPVIVNEKLQIIDGQARVEVCKEDGLPVYFCVIPGIGINECISLNATSTNWSLRDYINSYAELGNENYIRLKETISKYPMLGVGVITALASETMTRVSGSVLMSGEFHFEEKRLLTVINSCEWLYQNIVPVKTQIKGSFEMLCYAICFALEHTEAKHERLAKVIQENASRFAPLGNTVQALEEIERFYNYNIKNQKVYFATEYDKYCCKKNFGYGARWGREHGSRLAKKDYA